MKAGIFDAPLIKQLMKIDDFTKFLKNHEKRAWEILKESSS